jgi:hypothetical protein
VKKSKPPEIGIFFKVPDNRKLGKVSIQLDGTFRFLDIDGIEFIPEYMERRLQYARPKGAKIQTKQNTNGRLVTIGGLAELAEFDSVFIIDTNSRIINDRKVSASCFIRCRFFREEDGYRVQAIEPQANFYEFHDVRGNPELLAILKVANDITKIEGLNTQLKIAFVTDSALGDHEKICARKIPLYSHYFLPRPFTLIYASADTGNEAINRLIRSCDQMSSRYLMDFENGKLPNSELLTLQENPFVKHRFVMFSEYELISPILKGVGVNEKTKFTLYGFKKPNE